MATRNENNVLLTFKVLQFVDQIRRRAKSRIVDGSADLNTLDNASVRGLRAPKRSSNGLSLPSKQRRQRSYCGHMRVCRNNATRQDKPFIKPQASAAGGSVRSDRPAVKVQHMIRSVDQACGQETGLSATAGDDGKFLKHGNAPMFGGFPLKQLIELLITIQEALNTLATCRSNYGDAWLLDQGLELGLVMDESFIANYEHLLLRLRAELVEALRHSTLEELLRGGHDKRQRKLLAWFSEYAEKPRPLSTSFPWTIKPSLAVLWGVCWMFYDRDNASDYDDVSKCGTDRVRQDRVLRNLEFPTVPWSAPASSDYVNLGLELIGAQPRHGTQQPAANNMAAGLDGMFQARNTDSWEPALSPSLGDFRLPSAGGSEQVGLAQYGRYGQAWPSQNTYCPQRLEQVHSISPVDHFLPHTPGSPLTVLTNLGQDNSLNYPWQHDFPRNSLPLSSPRHLIAQQAPTITVTGTSEVDFAQPPGSAYPFGNPQNHIYLHNPQAPPTLDTSFAFNYPCNMVPQITHDGTPIQMTPVVTKHERTSSIASNSGMPTPASIGPRSPLLSPTSGAPSHVERSPHSISRRVSEDRSSVDEDDEGSMRKNHSYKRSEEPPRNQDGKMYCRHPDCTGFIFDRKCEWSKHMDKHDRPYKCNVKGCEKLQGFTYSGGLLRHEREVHKMHGGTKKSLFCPFSDCKRSSGAGFTRKENLAEHIRRVHRRTSMSADMHSLMLRRDTMESSPNVESRRSSESPYSRGADFRENDKSSLKRKRGSDAGLSDRGSDDMRAEIKRLRHENEEKDSRLRQLESAVMALQHQTRR